MCGRKKICFKCHLVLIFLNIQGTKNILERYWQPWDSWKFAHVRLWGQAKDIVAIVYYVRI